MVMVVKPLSKSAVCLYLHPPHPRATSDPLSLQLGEGATGVQDKNVTHLHNDIHGITVFLLALSKGPHIEGAEPQGQGTMEYKDEK